MPELYTAAKEHSIALDTLALQSKDPALYPPHAIGWWKDSYNGPRIVLSHLFVCRGIQRQGVGSSLLEEALSHGHRLGADTIELTPDPLARDFYTKAGAEVIRVFNEAPSYPTYAMKINCK